MLVLHNITLIFRVKIFFSLLEDFDFFFIDRYIDL